MSKRAVIYARVSTDDQADKGYGLPTQIELCLNYAEANDLLVIAQFKDDFTGASLDRPALNEMRAMLDGREAEAIIVHTADRLSRKLAHALLLREEWQRMRIEIHYVSRGRLEDTAESRLTDNIEGVIAEYEREKIRERTRRGRYAKAKAGKWVGAGPAPYGYRRLGEGINARLEIDEENAAVVRRVFSLYLGRVPTQDIARRLTEEGVRPPRGGAGWYPSTIKRILDNEVYTGVFYYGGLATDANGKRVRRPKSEQIRVDMPELALVDRRVFNAATQRRNDNRARSSRNRKRDYLLSGHLRCSCGAAMSGWARWGGLRADGNGRWLFLRYKCCGQRTYKHMTTCVEGYLRADETDELVWGWLHGLLSDPARLETGLEEMGRRQAGELAPKRQRLEMLSELIDKAEGKIKRLVKAFGDTENDTVQDALQGEIRMLGRQREALMAERSLLEAEVEQKSLTEKDKDRIRQEVADMRVILDAPDYTTKRFILDRIGLRIQIRSNASSRRLEVTCAIKAWTATLPLSIDKRTSPTSAGATFKVITLRPRSTMRPPAPWPRAAWAAAPAWAAASSRAVSAPARACCRPRPAATLWACW
jgi:site-specific DNA recombinase